MKKYYYLVLISFHVAMYAQHTEGRGGGKCGIALVEHPDDLSVCSNDEATFQIEAFGSGLVGYQWYHNNMPVGNGTDTYTILHATAADMGDYYCVVLGNCWNENSTHAQLTVGVPPVITVQPAPDTLLCPGFDFSVGLTSSNANAIYTWYHNNILVENAAESTITVQNAHYGDGGEYYCVVTDGGCSTTSSVAFVNQVVPPVIPAQTYSAGQTLADIEVNGSDVLWYASFEDSIVHENILPLSTLLVEGTTYNATQSINGCESMPEVVTMQFLGIEEFEITGTFYPNPVQDVLFFASDSELTSVLVYNILGQRILAKDISGDSGNINVSSLKKGSYVAVMVSEKTKKSIKFVKK